MNDDTISGGTHEPQKILVTYDDANGKPRAWATGPVDRRNDVLDAALRHANTYRREHPDTPIWGPHVHSVKEENR